MLCLSFICIYPWISENDVSLSNFVHKNTTSSLLVFMKYPQVLLNLLFTFLNSFRSIYKCVYINQIISSRNFDQTYDFNNCLTSFKNKNLSENFKLTPRFKIVGIHFFISLELFNLVFLPSQNSSLRLNICFSYVKKCFIKV